MDSVGVGDEEGDGGGCEGYEDKGGEDEGEVDPLVLGHEGLLLFVEVRGVVAEHQIVLGHRISLGLILMMGYYGG